MKHYIQKYSKSGIIHVGANTGQERELYSNMDKKVLWIEPNQATYNILKTNIRHIPKQEALCALILDEEKNVKFNISRQSGRSSIYDFTDHHFIDPNFKHSNTIMLPSIRLDSLDLNDFDTLITDTQGADLNVIKSLGDCIIKFNLIICEVFFEECYKNITLASGYDDFLYKHGFKRVGEYGKNKKWSNYIFIKK